MQIFSRQTELEMSQTIIDLIKKTVEANVNRNEVRYLRQHELMTYAGGVSKETVRKWVNMGLKEIKIGQVIMYDKQDVDVFMAKYKI